VARDNDHENEREVVPPDDYRGTIVQIHYPVKVVYFCDVTGVQSTVTERVPVNVN
jgi:hypothetical protein